MEDWGFQNIDPHLQAVVHSPNGQHVFVCSSNFIGRYWSGRMGIWDACSKVPDMHQIMAGAETQTGINDAKWFSPSGVIVASDSGAVEVWGFDSEDCILNNESYSYIHDDVVNSVAICCLGTSSYSASNDCNIISFDIETTSMLHKFSGHADCVHTVACHPTNDSLFLSCSQDGLVLIWDSRKEKPAKIFSNRTFSPNPSAVNWHPDGNGIAIGNEVGEILLADAKTDDIRCSSKPHSRFVYQVKFCSQDTSLLASVSHDGSVAVTKVGDDMQVIYENQDHEDSVHGLCWHNGDKSFCTCGWDQKVIIHALD